MFSFFSLSELVSSFMIFSYFVDYSSFIFDFYHYSCIIWIILFSEIFIFSMNRNVLIFLNPFKFWIFFKSGNEKKCFVNENENSFQWKRETTMILEICYEIHFHLFEKKKTSYTILFIFHENGNERKYSNILKNCFLASF